MKISIHIIYVNANPDIRFVVINSFRVFFGAENIGRRDKRTKSKRHNNFYTGRGNGIS